MFFDNRGGLVRVLVVGVLAYVEPVFLLRGSGKRTLSKVITFGLVITVALVRRSRRSCSPEASLSPRAFWLRRT